MNFEDVLNGLKVYAIGYEFLKIYFTYINSMPLGGILLFIFFFENKM